MHDLSDELCKAAQTSLNNTIVQTCGSLYCEVTINFQSKVNAV